MTAFPPNIIVVRGVPLELADRESGLAVRVRFEGSEDGPVLILEGVDDVCLEGRAPGEYVLVRRDPGDVQEQALERELEDARASERAEDRYGVCEQCQDCVSYGAAPATVYAIDPHPGGWGGFYCEPCAAALGFRITDRKAGS